MDVTLISLGFERKMTCVCDGNLRNYYGFLSIIEGDIVTRAQSKRKTIGEGRRSARALIVSTARRHFFVNGFRGITMDDLAAELGMSKKTLYAHFESKIELLQAVILNKIQDIEAAFDSVAKNQLPAFLDEVRQLLACVQHSAEEIRPPFFRDLQRDAPGLFTLVQSRRRDLIHQHFKKLFERGRQTGNIRKDIPTNLIIEILLGAIEAIVNPQKMSEMGLTPDTALSAILHVTLEGVVVRSERESR